MNRKRHTFFESMRVPVSIIFIGYMLIGIGSLFTSPLYGFSESIRNDYVEAFMELMMRTGRFIVVNFPLIIMLCLAGKKNNPLRVTASLIGYVAFLLATIFFSRETYGDSAYSSILGLSLTGSSVSWAAGSTRYPLQTGIIGALLSGWLTSLVFDRSDTLRQRRERPGEYHGAILATVLLCAAAGLGISLVWPWFMRGINWLTAFLSRDTSNPVYLALYGTADRVSGILGLGTLIRQPFWFGSSGGSWTNAAGQAVTGDVSIWTARMAQDASASGTTGRFITPYYVLNIFALPGMMCAMYSMETDHQARRRKRLFLFLGIAASMLCGTVLPMELVMVLLCPLLYVVHLLITALLYHILFSFQICLGYQTSSLATQAALPGTLPELLVYAGNSALRRSVLGVTAAGVLCFALYFLMTRLYFSYAAIGMVDPQKEADLVEKTIEALGGINNILSVDASASSLTVGIYDQSSIDADKLRNTGAEKIYEDSENHITLCFGGASCMIRKAILDQRRSMIRDVD